MSKIQLNFLGANVPLTKCFRANGEKDSYPMVGLFTSYSEPISTIEEFFNAVVKHGKEGHCLIKGKLKRNLNNESRAKATSTDDTTRWVCLDFDRFETPDIDEVLAAMGLAGVSYVIQYSSSHGLPANHGTISAHVFMLIDQEVPAPTLKAWLMGININKFSEQIKLSRTSTQLTWPLDITTCQNDKLLYIAPPRFEKPLKDPVQTRVRLIKGKKPHITASTTIAEPNINSMKALARKQLNTLRKAVGLPDRKGTTKWVGDKEIESKPDVCQVTSIKDCGDWVRLNLNGGDSWAYAYAKANPEHLYDFKSDTWYLTKEIIPGHYKEIKAEQADNAATPSEDGDLILAFTDVKTGLYYKGLWNPEHKKLELYKARDRSQIQDWWKSFGRVPPDYIENWEIVYNPRADWMVDVDNHKINIFKPSEYMKLEGDKTVTTDDFPNIYNMVRHFLGESGSETQITEHFLNWFACIFQRKKPITAWVNHGVQGTGKGYFMSKVVTPLLGKSNVAEVGIENIEDQFNGWQEGRLFINVNEVNVDDFTSKGRVESKFKRLITDDTVPVRRMQQTMSIEPNYASYLFSSNERRPCIVPADDRRYNIGNRQGIKLVPPKEEDVEKELEAFAQWLLAHRADVKLASEILQTEARERIQKLSLNSLEETCQIITTGDFDSLWMNMVDDDYLARGAAYNEIERIYNGLIKDIGHRILDTGVRQTLTRDDMGIILRRCVGSIPQEPNKLTSLLRHNGIETKQVRSKDRKTYGIHVVWHVSPEILKEMEEVLGSKPKLRRLK